MEAIKLREQAKESADQGNYLVASIFVSQAIKAYTRLNDSAALQELKHLSIEYRRKADKEYRKVSTSVKMPREEIEQMVSTLTRYQHISKNFRSIADERLFLQDFNEIAAFARDNKPISAIFTQHSATDQDGHLVSFEDFDEYWQAEQYNIWQNYSTNILVLVLNKLSTEGKLRPDALLRYFKKSRIYNPSELRKLSAAFQSLDRHDYISTLHVLIPTFETVFMRLSARLGIDTIALGRGTPTTSQRTLSTNLLLSGEFIDVWGVDYCRQVNFVLFDRYGYSLRHKIAHGSISDKSCNIYTFSLIMYLYIYLIETVTVTPNSHNPRG